MQSLLRNSCDRTKILQKKIIVTLYGFSIKTSSSIYSIRVQCKRSMVLNTTQVRLNPEFPFIQFILWVSYTASLKQLRVKRFALEPNCREAQTQLTHSTDILWNSHLSPPAHFIVFNSLEQAIKTTAARIQEANIKRVLEHYGDACLFTALSHSTATPCLCLFFLSEPTLCSFFCVCGEKRLVAEITGDLLQI